MNHDGSEPSKTWLKFRCPLASRKYGCSCSTPCSDSKYGKTVHFAMKDNPRPVSYTHLYHTGDVAWIQKKDSLANGEIGIFYLNGNTYIKELHDCLLYTSRCV